MFVEDLKHTRKFVSNRKSFYDLTAFFHAHIRFGVLPTGRFEGGFFISAITCNIFLKSVFPSAFCITFATLKFKCGYGEIGRRARLRIWCREACGFDPLYPHFVFSYLIARIFNRTILKSPIYIINYSS